MNFSVLDWIIIAIYLLISLVIGVWSSRGASKDTQNYFLAGRNMPWWLLGISMVATTFSTDTPNLVTDLVRQNGVSANWAWWSFLITGMLTVFIYAKLWRRSGVITDIEFYELRYGGNPAAFLRGFRALYLGLVFNVLIMGSVSLAAVKFGEIVLNIPGWLTLLVACSITMIYSTMGGLKAVIITDCIQFFLAMIGSVWAMFFIINLPEIGGLDNLLNHENVYDKLSILPDFSDPDIWVPLLLVPLCIQWWASYYPGSEPGGGGYIAQRMFSAKNESHAIKATFLFNLAHYALRPWPWIMIALSSLIIFPDLNDIKNAFPDLSQNKLGHDVAYPAMLTLLPNGLMGLVCASMIAAFMSTISTQVNLGASYFVNDFYKRFFKKNSSQLELVRVGRIFSIFSIIAGSFLGLFLTSASQAFSLLLLLGSGTGAIYILRWFWWRINAYSEIIAMISSLLISIYLTFFDTYLFDWQKIVVGAILTTIIWILATYITPAEKHQILNNFILKVNPGGPGWSKFGNNSSSFLKTGLFRMCLGIVVIYSVLFSIGNLLYSNYLLSLILIILSIFSFWFIIKDFD
ncbi:MAG: Na+:solute symporter [Candidatus Marinimicrobia bacterium]|nr:Na+:solute symporter [Candidatus Neomarinimicrobiota bacterium]OUW49849.1 MAG: Na+:solute symporter [bacterium TMED190]|tara:strand:- start:9953 stop:11677 length:1725 start_codon:yes stop_codon:yes gene_type:complete